MILKFTFLVFFILNISFCFSKCDNQSLSDIKSFCEHNNNIAICGIKREEKKLKIDCQSKDNILNMLSTECTNEQEQICKRYLGSRYANQQGIASYNCLDYNLSKCTIAV